MQIKDLEEMLGAALFERSARKVRLTAFGEDVLARVGGILRSVEELADLARTQNELSGRLRIGVIPTIAPYLLPTFVHALSQANRDLDIHVRETLTHNLIDELAEGRLDTAIVALPVSEPSLTEVELFSENFVLVRPRADQNKPVPDNKELREMRLLLLEEGHCFRDQALSFCNLRPALARDGLDGSSLSTLVQMVGAGIGVTLIPEMAVDVETRATEVAVSRLKGPQPGRTIGMIWRKTNPLAPQLEAISDVIRQAASTRHLEKSI